MLCYGFLAFRAEDVLVQATKQRIDIQFLHATKPRTDIQFFFIDIDELSVNVKDADDW